MIVRLILSVDRSRSIEDNTQILLLAAESRKKSNVLVGVDFSGNPTIRLFRDFSDLLKQCRTLGLLVTTHAGEVPDKDIEIIENSVRHESEINVGDVLGIYDTLKAIIYNEMDDILAFRYE